MTISKKLSNINPSDFIPILYYYEHCPYCVRVLAFAALANITLKKVVLANDDEATPIGMVGAKTLPILETQPDDFMAESLDIIKYLSEQNKYPLAKNESLQAEVNEFVAANRIPIYSLLMPRCITQSLKEFQTESAVDYFVNKKTASIGDFTVAMANSQGFIEELSTSLESASELFDRLSNQLSNEAAITLFSALYGVFYVKDFTWPLAAKTFMCKMAQSTKLPLFEMTCKTI